MSYVSLVAGLTIADPKVDRKNSIRVDNYHVGEQAVYVTKFPYDRYIPYGAVRKVWYQASQLSVSCCCGKGIPVFVVCVKYDDGAGEEKLQKYMVEHKEDAEQLAELIKARCNNLDEE